MIETILYRDMLELYIIGPQRSNVIEEVEHLRCVQEE